MGFWKQFEKFDPLTGQVPHWLNSKLNDIVWRARNLLRGRKSDEINHIAQLASGMIEDYFKEARQDEIGRLRSEQKWEFLEIDQDGACDINQDRAEDLSYPTPENTKDIDALAECVGSWANVMGSGSPDPENYEYFAAVALWKAADAIYRVSYSYDFKMRTHKPRDRKSLLPHDWITAGEMVVEAMEAVCRAEQLRSEVWKKTRFDQILAAITDRTSAEIQRASDEARTALEVEEARRKSEHGRAMAALSKKNRNESMAAVLAEWEGDPVLQKMSNAKAGVRLSNWLAKQDLEHFEPRTVAEWISAHKRNSSVE